MGSAAAAAGLFAAAASSRQQRVMEAQRWGVCTLRGAWYAVCCSCNRAAASSSRMRL